MDIPPLYFKMGDKNLTGPRKITGTVLAQALQLLIFPELSLIFLYPGISGGAGSLRTETRMG
jgi:hypothetical protein